MTPWTEYVADIRPYLPECPDVLIVGAIRDAAADFCERTLCWQDNNSIIVAASERDIPLAQLIASTNVLVVRLLYLGNDDGVLKPKSQQWLDNNRPLWRTELDSPEFYCMPVKGEVLWLAPHTDITLTLNTVAAFKPGPNSVDGPDDLFDNYRTPIQSGALEILCDIPKKPWSNSGLATKHGNKFEAAIGPALVAATRSNTSAPIRTTSNYRF